MKDSVFDVYEPHAEYLQAVVLRPENFDAVADELSRCWDSGEHYLVGKVIRNGEPYALTLTSVGEDSEETPITCHLHQMLVRRPGKPLEVMDRHELRHDWRLVAADPYRNP